MAGTVSQSVDYDFETGLVAIRARGELDILAASALRITVLKWLAEHPLCLIVDLTRIEVPDEACLRDLPAIARRLDGTPIFVVVDPGTVSGRVIEGSVRDRMMVFTDEREAVRAATAFGNGRIGRFHLHMWGEPDAPARARRLVQKACDAWDLPELTGVAQVIISELVTNAVRHAGGDFEVTVALGEYHLHIHVRDRDRHVPRLFTRDSPDPRHSRGMKLIDGLASGWGTALRPYGKSVWATLRIEPEPVQS